MRETKDKTPERSGICAESAPFMEVARIAGQKRYSEREKFDDNDRAKIASAIEESKKYHEQFRKLLLDLYQDSPQE